MEYITINNAKKIKSILLNNFLKDKSINLEYKNLNARINIDKISLRQSEAKFHNMNTFYFLNKNEYNENDVLEINNKKYELSMSIGDWGYEYRIENLHIVLSTNYTKFGSSKDYFSQLEISQALEDNDYIYIVKNLSSLSGHGAISRLNHGLKDKKEKFERRNMLVNKLNALTCSYEKKEWIVISKIVKKDLDDEKVCDDIFYSLIKDILNYSFTVEDIISEDRNTKSYGSYI